MNRHHGPRKALSAVLIAAMCGMLGPATTVQAQASPQGAGEADAKDPGRPAADGEPDDDSQGEPPEEGDDPKEGDDDDAQGGADGGSDAGDASDAQGSGDDPRGADEAEAGAGTQRDSQTPPTTTTPPPQGTQDPTRRPEDEAQGAQGQHRPEPAADEVFDPGLGARALYAGAALVPGALVHGTGHLLAGEKQTGLRLLAAEGLGLGLILGGLGGLAATGASPRLVAPFASMAIGGVGLFGTSLLADLYGVLAPPGGVGAPVLREATLDADLGYRFVFNPTLETRHLTLVGASWRSGPWRLSPRAWVAVDNENYRLEAIGAWRISGARPDQEADDGSWLELVGGVVHHRFGTERFSNTTGELALQGRLDLARVGPTLSGAFVEMGGGVALGGTHYDDITTEATDMLLGNFGLGLYLGHRRDGWGELTLYYDHRHDGYVEGLKSKGLGSGAAGHFGLRTRFQLDGAWGVELITEAGASVMAGASLVYRMGGHR